ncbi:MAG: hypothetical protein U9R46_06380 [Bacteroidota bacterium]|nr:hypothetical protein [Bacteroidota bacterium]
MHVRSKLDVDTTIGFTLEARKDQGRMNVEQGMMNVEWERRFIIHHSLLSVQYSKAPIDIGAEHEKMLLPLLTVLQK